MTTNINLSGKNLLYLFLIAISLALILSCCSHKDNSKNTNNSPSTINKSSSPTDNASPPEISKDKHPVEKPKLISTLSGSFGEAWLGSPAIADINNDGKPETIVSRYGTVVVWNSSGEILWTAKADGGRIWASPLVADFVPSQKGLELVFASRDKIFVYYCDGKPVNGFPVKAIDEIRSIAGGDVDGDKDQEIIAVTTNKFKSAGKTDIIFAYHGDGTKVKGFPPNTSGSSGWDNKCYVTGGFDQNVAVGDVDGDKIADIFATQDNAYLSLHKSNGFAFNAAKIFKHPNKFLGIRFLLDYKLAMQGWANNEETSNQAHFTNSAPAITDIDGDGKNELLVLSSVQNANQSDRFRGFALWALKNDGSRIKGWEAPFYIRDYLAGLWDFEGTNVVAATNQVSVGNLYNSKKGSEFVFAGFDGKIHCVGSNKDKLWDYSYTNDKMVLTGGIAICDLSKDNIPEVVFNSYSPQENKSNLFILSNDGKLLYKLPLPGRGAMPVPAIGDVNGNGILDIVVSLKDGGSKQILVYEIPGSANNYMPWSMGRGNLLRNGMLQQ